MMIIDFITKDGSTFVAFCGIVVTLILGISGFWRERTKLKIEQQKLRPLAHVGYFDGESELYITLENKGEGVMQIVDFYFQNRENKSIKKEGIFDFIKLGYRYKNYSGNQNNTVVAPGDVVNLLHLVGKDGDKEYKKICDSIRKELKDFKIVVKYKDIYNKKMPPYERSLIWFGRKKD